jgi:signal peptidase I
MESATALLIDPALAAERFDRAAEAEPEAAVTRERRSLLRRLRPGAIVAGLVLAAAVGGLLYLQTWPPMATVMSASMSPTIKTGDVVLLKHMETPPRVGQVIAVNVPDLARSRYGYPPVVVHRVVRIAPNGDVTTKGDARPRPDPFTVPARSVNARVVATIPAAGHVMAFFTSTLGLVWLGGGVLLLVILPLLERQRDVREREEETLEELRGELRAVSHEVALLRTQPQADAVAEYLWCFETELVRALGDVTRELELDDVTRELEAQLTDSTR